MSDQPIRFDDGAAYERFMGGWSRLAGGRFLDWIAPPPGQRWVDVGCGNGAFTELLFERLAPVAVEGCDPSPGQLAYATERLRGQAARFRPGTAEALPFADAAFDAAVMALVIFFVPTPEKGVAEMVRVVRPGGLVCAYAWDIPGGGFPAAPLTDALLALGVEPPWPPRADVATREALQDLWQAAGLEAVATREIEVERVFESVGDWWASCLSVGALAATVDRLADEDRRHLEEMVRARLTLDAAGRVLATARANAVSGCTPH